MKKAGILLSSSLIPAQGPMPEYINALSQVIQEVHGCERAHERTDLVHEEINGRTIWQQRVETFTLTGHPKAARAFAWGWNDEDGSIRYVAILELESITSPLAAVQMAAQSREENDPSESGVAADE